MVRHGEWRFTNANQWTYSFSLGGGYVVGNGYDDEDERWFTGTLTDTTPVDYLCSYLTFSESTGYQMYVACNGSVEFVITESRAARRIATAPA